MTPDSSAPTVRWWKDLNRYHWFLFTMAAAAWVFDCLDQQLFLIARNPAIKDLLPDGTGSETVMKWGGYATAIFVAGWATGGLIFGAIGDRIGRAKTLTITVLLYSLFTGLSAFSQSVYDFSIYRFITGLGVGGVFGLAVALIADGLPDRARPHALGLMQALSAFGNITAGLVAVGLGMWLANATPKEDHSWRYLFLVGALPAFLCVFIQMKLKEPEKWVKAREAGKLTGVRFGSYASLFGDARWRKPALLGVVLCIAGVVGLWGVGFFSPELIGNVIGKKLQADNVPPEQIQGKRMTWIGINMVMQNIGAFFGMMAFTKAAQTWGRKPVFAFAFVAAFLSTVLVFKGLTEYWQIFVYIPVMGFFQLALFAGFAIYLPELFPVSLRSTGTSFCYNVGRFIAASGPFTLGLLQAKLAAGAVNAEAKLDAFRNACAWVSSVFLVGLVALFFLPETKDRAMPED